MNTFMDSRDHGEPASDELRTGSAMQVARAFEGSSRPEPDMSEVNSALELITLWRSIRLPENRAQLLETARMLIDRESVGIFAPAHDPRRM